MVSTYANHAGRIGPAISKTRATQPVSKPWNGDVCTGSVCTPTTAPNTSCKPKDVQLLQETMTRRTGGLGLSRGEILLLLLLLLLLLQQHQQDATHTFYIHTNTRFTHTRASERASEREREREGERDRETERQRERWMIFITIAIISIAKETLLFIFHDHWVCLFCEPTLRPGSVAVAPYCVLSFPC